MFVWEDFGRMKKGVENMRENGWKREGERKMFGLAILSLGPPKLLLSPNCGENKGEKGKVCFGLNCHFSATFCFLGIFWFFDFFYSYC